MTDDRELEVMEDELLSDPEILSEAARYEPVLAKLSTKSLLGLWVVARREMTKRQRQLYPTGRIGR